MMVDCGHDGGFHPIDDFKKFLPEPTRLQPKLTLRSLVLTNYDNDHFSGLPNLHKAVHIKSTLLPKNLSMEEVWALKSEPTEALETLSNIRSTYNQAAVDWIPPFNLQVFSLVQAELSEARIPIETNHLSQMVFVEYGETTFCIPGDMEKKSWELILNKKGVQDWLSKTNILMASHHGRYNGYHKDIFDYCSPSCVIFSDKGIVHDTQKNMASLYASHVLGGGISYINTSGETALRKTLTTRNDGHILVTVPRTGPPTFKAHL